jgi:retron-type reverse transcriptase
MEDGKRMRVEEGTPQEGSASPLLANIYLHYMFDLWVQTWRRKQACGDMVVVRYADDFVLDSSTSRMPSGSGRSCPSGFGSSGATPFRWIVLGLDVECC